MPKRLLLIAVARPRLPRRRLQPRTRRSSRATCRSAVSGRSRRRRPRRGSTSSGCTGVGPGTVQFRTRSLAGRWSGWVDAAPEAEDRPDAGTPERARAGTWRLGNPWWVGPREPDRVPLPRHGHPAAGALRLEPRRRGAGAHAAEGGRAGDRATQRLERRREDQRAAARRSRPALRLAVVHHTAGANGYTRGAVAGDRAGDPALPREGQRLERHRLQLPRRPLRHRLRGPLRRDRAKRRRRARGGVQHRHGRRRRARGVQLPGRRGEGAGVAREAARLAARRRSCRPGDHAVVHLGRKRALRAGPARVPAHGLRAPRHRLHRLSGHRALQPAHGDRRRGREDRPAEAVRAARHRHRPGAGPLPGAPVGAAAVDGRRLRRRRKRGASRARGSARTSTGPGTRPCCCRAATRTRSARMPA